MFFRLFTSVVMHTLPASLVFLETCFGLLTDLFSGCFVFAVVCFVFALFFGDNGLRETSGVLVCTLVVEFHLPFVGVVVLVFLTVQGELVVGVAVLGGVEDFRA